MSTSERTNGKTLPREAMLAIAFAQGLALFALWKALDNEVWPATMPAVNFPLWTLVLVLPTFLLFTLESGSGLRTLRRASAIAAIFVLLAIYAGWQATPQDAFPIGPLLFDSVASLVVAGFVSLALLQSPRFDYAALFANAWRNALAGILSVLLTLGLRLLLLLWGALFKEIGIDFFSELFAKQWFLFPVLSTAFGFGVYIFRSKRKTLERCISLIEGIMRLLAPLALGVATLFLAALPFTGLAPLWETGHGTALLLWLNALAIFFLIGVYQPHAHGGIQTPYPQFVHRALLPGIALLPAISILGIYGLTLRIAQYGWTVARCWAALAAGVLLLFSLGYAWGVLRYRSRWTAILARTNVTMLWIILALLLLANSPLLDFRAISASSQFARLESGEIAIEQMDLKYAHRHLARPGHLRLETLAAEVEAAQPELARRIRDGEFPEVSHSTEDFWDMVHLHPEPFPIPDALRSLAAEAAEKRKMPPETAVFLTLDLDGDGELEYVLLDGSAKWHSTVQGLGFYREGDGWKHALLEKRDAHGLRESSGGEVTPSPNPPHRQEWLQRQPISAVEPPRRFDDVRVGEMTLEVRIGQ